MSIFVVVTLSLTQLLVAACYELDALWFRSINASGIEFITEFSGKFSFQEEEYSGAACAVSCAAESNCYGVLPIGGKCIKMKPRFFPNSYQILMLSLKHVNSTPAIYTDFPAAVHYTFDTETEAHIEYQPSYQTVTGQNGKALDLTAASGDYAKIGPTVTGVCPLKPWVCPYGVTFMAWIKIADSGGNQVFWHDQGSVYWINGGKVRCANYEYLDSGDRRGFTSITVDDFSLFDEWFLLTVTFANGTGVRIYLNGEEQAADMNTAVESGRTATDMEYFWIGTQKDNPTNLNAQMLIDEFKVWDYEQSPEVIKAYFSAQ